MMRFLKSLRFAIAGIKQAIREEQNMQIHCVATCLTLLSAGLLQLAKEEWLWILLSITLVWITELLNTAIETLTDLVAPDYHVLAKKVKDIAAGAVLLTAIFAVVTGSVVFFPKVIVLLRAL